MREYSAACAPTSATTIGKKPHTLPSNASLEILSYNASMIFLIICNQAATRIGAEMDMDRLFQFLGEIEAVPSAISVFAVCIAVWTIRESQRPQIAAFLEHDRDIDAIRLVIKNFGNGIARNLQITNFDFSIVQPNLNEPTERSFLTSGIATLVPRASRDTVLFAGAGALKKYGHLYTTISISFEEIGFFGQKRVVHDQFVLETASFSGSLYSKSDSHLTTEAIQSIAKSLEENTRARTQ